MIEKIAHYRILKPIGAGGMGEVYLAEDLKLGRKVALKLLPGEIAADRKRLNRFLQEARLAANLNHPHICTIFEIDADLETPYLAMELVDGETLADLIDRQSLTADEIIGISIQIADALDEAHSAGIIHRDIKSSNIILNRRGQVKILDFGLAKNIAENVSDDDVTRARTEDGMLVGTVQYMSPEQALGKPLDGRTDIWSLGVLMHEMASGELPFKEATQAGTFDAILNRPPPPFPDETPPELAAIVDRLLEKDRALRYQTAADLLADLKRLRRARGGVSESGESVALSASIPRAALVSSGIAAGSNRRKAMITAAIVLALAAVAAVAGLRYWRSESRAIRIDPGNSTRQTNLGKVVDAAISPAGDHIVYVTDDGAKQTLWIKQTSGGSALQIVPPSENVYQGLAVSPDNRWIYYNVWDRVSVGEIYRIPALGGAPQKIVHDCMPGVSVSPDGSRAVFVRSDDRNRRFVVLNIGADGTDEREILSLPGAFAFQPTWTPDGTAITFGMFGAGADQRYPQIVEMPANGGEMKTIWSDPENRIQPSRFAWLPDKSGLILTLTNSREFRSQIWQIDYPSGKLRQITKDFNSYGAISVAAKGGGMLAVQQDLLLSVWNVPVDNPSAARRITDGKSEGVGVSWTPDGQIVYSSNVGGNADIWIMNADGSGKRQLTSDPTPKLAPCVSGDGKYIFYGIVGNERGGAARMGLDGRNPENLENKWSLLCSDASDKIAYQTEEKGLGVKGIIDNTDFSAPATLFEKIVVGVELSPDGKQVAYVFWDEEKRRHGFEIMNLADRSVRPFEFPTTAVQRMSSSQFVFRWTPDGKNLSFVNDENGFANIWILPLGGGKSRRLTQFNDNFVFAYAWSRDGKQLAVSRGTLTSDAILFGF